MTPNADQFETVAGRRFALWKRPIQMPGIRFDIWFCALTAVLVLLGFLVLAPRPRVVRPFTQSAILALQFGTLLVLLRRRPKATPQPDEGDDGSYWVKIKVIADKPTGFAYGRLTVENGIVTFKSDAFDLVLATTDLARKASRPDKVGYYLKVHQPEPKLTRSIAITPLSAGNRVVSQAQLKKELNDLLSSAPVADFERLYPPLRSGYATPFAAIFVSSVVAGAGLAAMFLLMALVLPVSREDGVAATVSSLLLPLIIGMSSLVSVYERRRKEMAIDAIVRRNGP